MPPQKYAIVIIDDDEVLRSQLAAYLEQHGHVVLGFASGREALKAWDEAWCLVLLDIMLPNEDGLEICRAIRARSATPIIFLSALGEETDKVVGLELGADDYLVKPFSPRELLARIRTVLRRSRADPEIEVPPEEDESLLCFAGWVFDKRRRLLHDESGTAFSLSAAEFRLLRVFLEHPQVVLTRDFLLKKIGRSPEVPYDRVLDVQVSRLRARLGDNAREQHIIRTARGDGYMLVVDVTKGSA